MLRKIFSLAVALVIVLPFGVSCKPEPEPETADWDALYETALGWGYEGSLDEFVAILTRGIGDKDNPAYANKSAYEICAYTTEEEFIDELINEKLNWWPVSYGFYTMQWAYNNGLLTKRELRSIAYYHHDGYKTTYNKRTGTTDSRKEVLFRPIPKKPTVLDEETINKIQQARWEYFLYGGWDSYYTIDQVYILKYCGTYNGYTAVTITEPFSEAAMKIEKIGDSGLYFSYGDFSYTCLLWKEKE